ncbi:MAG: DUF1848 family protein [Candidatus Eisenbacteria bacterium]|nr:DUF1848 family protein [Candidatus Eisenbacteria bacterium]
MDKQEELGRPLIVSASRTRDMVHRCPDLLARILAGDAPCRFGPHGQETRLAPERIHSVVLWTKDLANLLEHAELRRTLQALIERHRVQISLGLTITGLGGTFLEPGIPHWRTALADLRALLAQGWIDPRAVIYRYDPFLAVRTPDGHLFTNASLRAFVAVCTPVLQLGVKRVTTSRGDALRYPKVARRVASVGLAWLPIEDAAAVAFCRQVDTHCRSRGADFSVCCEPFASGLLDNWGCIDGHWLNALKGPDSEAATIVPHNRIGSQRAACRCTYSRDIGYSTGSRTCFSGGYGCLYCFAQTQAGLPGAEELRAEIAAYDQDPEGYCRERDLPDLTHMS